MRRPLSLYRWCQWYILLFSGDCSSQSTTLATSTRFYVTSQSTISRYVDVGQGIILRLENCQSISLQHQLGLKLFDRVINIGRSIGTLTNPNSILTLFLNLNLTLDNKVNLLNVQSGSIFRGSVMT